jgi:peptidoglycan/LPS O-acetylase OafA/YrhL/lysophospholipase L1-like esterase
VNDEWCVVSNYEVDKLVINHPEWVNAALLGGILILSLALLKRERTGCFAPALTNQIKGAAMLLVVIGHVWTYVTDQRVTLVLAAQAVFVFLLLSGFGLSMSSKSKPLRLDHYVKRRLSRVMIPYWLATAIILAMDKSLLARTYQFHEILLTFVGVNVSPALRHLDFVRWFITLLLTWYVLFFVFNRLSSRKGSIGWMLLAGLVLSGLSLLDVFPFGAPYHIMAFPLGCLLADRFELIRKMPKHPLRVVWLLLLIICMLAMLHAHASIQPSVELPAYLKLTRILLSTATSLLLTLALIVFVHLLARHGFVSRFLTWTGTISYELFLIHGALLVKYNPVLGSMPSIPPFLSLTLWLIAILLLSALFHRGIRLVDPILSQSVGRIAFTAILLFLLSVLVVRTDLLYRTCDLVGIPHAAVEHTEHYHNMVAYHARMDGSIPSGSILFIGDSITQSLCVSAVHAKGVNLGIGTDTTAGVLKRLPIYSSRTRAKLVVLAIGLNDLKYRSEHDILSNYKAILDEIPQDVPVLISAILPVDERASGKHVNGIIQSINRKLRGLTTARPRCHFIDSGQNMLDSNSDLRDEYHVGDGVHLSTEGYRIWINDLKSALASSSF